MKRLTQLHINLFFLAVTAAIWLLLLWPHKVWDTPTAMIHSSEVERGTELDFTVANVDGIDPSLEIGRTYLCGDIRYNIDTVNGNSLNATLVVPPRVPVGSQCTLELSAVDQFLFRSVTNRVVADGQFTAI